MSVSAVNTPAIRLPERNVPVRATIEMTGKPDEVFKEIADELKEVSPGQLFKMRDVGACLRMSGEDQVWCLESLQKVGVTNPDVLQSALGGIAIKCFSELQKS